LASTSSRDLRRSTRVLKKRLQGAGGWLPGVVEREIVCKEWSGRRKKEKATEMAGEGVTRWKDLGDTTQKEIRKAT
jgi:hypothetical protein